ncbi:MAG: imidazole glycerol phosphate synthase subunit HisF [Flavobacteriales bacterium]|nr:imidazole glycerol phosphate synthase subunit HisF [Flavobacteriales bacterium]MBO73050.1 imidazole glycerol phosphate synthase subunit HisF [Flavobacteriales bacterium]|tara:strand:- start:4609 stop:5373 length:765 start_codon:yes stop_codon:yes gene_type:complete
MFRPRIIPVLLLKDKYLVKSIEFKKHQYIGDPINAVKIYNDLKADELVFLDINASAQNRTIDVDFVSKLSEETNMPFAVGGGIKSIEQIQNLIAAGAEKIIINSEAVENPNFVKQASEEFGTSTVVVCIDVKKKLFKGNKVWSKSGKKASNFSPLEFAKLMEKNGAGEIIIQSIENDGKMTGYDYELVKEISSGLTIPVVALGGASNYNDLEKAHSQGLATGLGAGSIFVYQSKLRGVLINYPSIEERVQLFNK